MPSDKPLRKTKNGENPDTALGIALNSTPSDDPIALTDFSPRAQVHEAAKICYYKDDHEQAMKHIEKKIDPETLAPRIPQSEAGRVNTVNILTRSLMKSKERDMEKIIHHWQNGIEVAKAVQSENSFRAFVATHEAMEFAWPGEQRILKLREHIVHWADKART